MRDISIFIEHIIESIKLIETYTHEIAKEEFLSSHDIQDKVFRRLEIIGEAAKNLPEEFRKSHPEIEWKKMAGLRDVLIHSYFGIDLELAWKVIEKDIPDLKNKISKITF
jgi:uncharacterized protein with HEPN domain